MLKLRTLFMLVVVIGASAFALGCVKGATAYEQAPNETLITTNQYYDQYEGPASVADPY